MQTNYERGRKTAVVLKSMFPHAIMLIKGNSLFGTHYDKQLTPSQKEAFLTALREEMLHHSKSFEDSAQST